MITATSTPGQPAKGGSSLSPTSDELVGVAEIAERLAWDRRRVSTYVGRGLFPEPVAELAMGKVWRWDDVKKVAVERGWINTQE